MREFAGKRVTVAGLGRFGGGIVVSRWLVEQGARVLVTDEAPAEKLADSVKQLEGVPVRFHLGEHREEHFRETDLVVTSPALPPTNRYLAIAREAGVPVTTEIRLFVERCPAPIIGVTGTKGKSTTTTLIGRCLQERFTTWVGGNLGGSLLPKLPEIQADDCVVLELSSFMLQHLDEDRWSPHVAVFTMLAADHLEWHGSLDAYLAAKQTMLRYQKAGDWAVLCEENPQTPQMARAAAGFVLTYGVNDRRPFELQIPGRHNQLNAQAAYAAASIFGISWDEAQDALRDFRGLPHRLQLVHEAAGVRYFNDSIATIPDAAVAAAHAFAPDTVIQIVGGYDKGLPFDAMAAALARHNKAVLCIGQTGPAIAALLSAAPITVRDCGDLPTAMREAKQIAQPGDVVLLSTGCASYGQFFNFEERGQRFADLARLQG